MLIVLLGSLLAPQKVPTQSTEPQATKSKAETDVLGRPIPFGKPTKGAYAAIHLGRSNLAFGQPLRFALHIRKPSSQGPYANLHFATQNYIPRNLTIKMQDAQGKNVDFNLVGFGYSAGLNGTVAHFQVNPKGKFGLGRHWKTGEYQITGEIGFPYDEKAKSYTDKIVTNTFKVHIADPGKVPPLTQSEQQVQSRVVSRIRDLGDANDSVRDAAEKKLKEETNPIALIPLAKAVEVAKGDKRARLNRIVEKWASRLFQVLESGSERFLSEGMLFLGSLSEEDANIVIKHLARSQAQVIEVYQVMRMQVGAVKVPQNRVLHQQEKDTLIAALKDPNPMKRMQALHSIPTSADKDILLVAGDLMFDPFSYTPRMMPGHPVPIHLIANKAREIVSAFESKGIPVLIASARKRLEKPEDNWWQVYQILELLAKQAPDATAHKFFLELAEVKHDNTRGTAIHHLGAWGAKSVPLFRKVVSNSREVAGHRAKAAMYLGQFGDPKIDGPVLSKLLNDGPVEMQKLLAVALTTLKYQEALPALDKLARNKTGDWAARIYGIRAVIALTERKVWEKLLLDLTDPAQGTNVRGDVLAMLGGYKVKAGIPRLLEALTDTDSYARELANRGLHSYVDHRVKLPYNVLKPDPGPWKEYFRKNPVK